jgi:hypothetical protein
MSPLIIYLLTSSTFFKSSKGRSLYKKLKRLKFDVSFTYPEISSPSKIPKLHTSAGKE